MSDGWEYGSSIQAILLILINPVILSTLLYPHPVEAKPQTCRCGFDKTHPRVRPEKEYSFWGQLIFGLMYTPLPTAIRYRCGVCKIVVGEVTDPALLEKFRYREPRPEER